MRPTGPDAVRPSPAASSAGERTLARPQPPPQVPAWWWVAAAAAGCVTLVISARYGGAVVLSRFTGLPDPGTVTAWGMPTTRLLVDLLGSAAIGFSAAAAFLLPGEDRTVGAAGYRMLRLASWAAGGWALACSAMILLTVSDLLGQPVSAITPRIVVSFIFSVSQGQALALQVTAAAAAATVARLSTSRTAAAFVAALCVVGVVPPAFAGHAAGAGNHQLAVSSLTVHVLAASLWLGGLLAVLLLRPRRLVPDVAARYSRIALVCFVAVAVSGVANAAVRLGDWSQLWHSTYGQLVLGKLAALLALGGFGAAHRRWALRRLSASAPAAFVQLAAGEVIVFAATFGLAAAMSRSPTPVPTNPVEFDAFTDLVGFALPPPPTAAGMLGQPLPDLLMLTIAAAGLTAYLGGVIRLHRTGRRWPWSRTVPFVAGVVVFAAVTNLGVARYAYLLFSVHMAQHMVLSMVVPGLLVAGAPITLALRAMRAPTDPGVRGGRDWLRLALRSRPARLLTHPLVALGIYVVGLYGLYLSSLFPSLMRSHFGHTAMIVHFVLSGYLLAWVLVGIDPGRRRWSPPLLILVLFAAMVFHAFFGVTLMQSQELIGGSWFGLVHPPWAASLSADQTLGAGIAWAFGEIPAAVLMAALMVEWMRADEREQRRLDRAADRAEAEGIEDELARYNEFLRRANAQPGA